MIKYGLRLDEDHLPLIIQEKKIKKEAATIKNSNDMFHFLIKHEEVGTLAVEKLFAFYLNNSNQVLGYYEVSSGNAAMTICNMQGIMTVACALGATGIILSHNHPTCKLIPSVADKTCLYNFEKACEVMGIQCLDFMITGRDTFISMLTP